MHLTITPPDDMHLHLRDGRAMADVVAHTARYFARAVIMPNLQPPITTATAARAYRQRIVNALPEDLAFATTRRILERWRTSTRGTHYRLLGGTRLPLGESTGAVWGRQSSGSNGPGGRVR